VTPRVTVLMPVYNAAAYVGDAAASILTGSYRDLELLAIDDGSTDRSAEILHAFSDNRLRVVANPKNLGLVATLNRGLDLAQGDLIARMDADDVSVPQRLARQVEFMDSNPEIGLSGTWAQSFGGGRSGVIRVPLRSAEICVQLFGYNALCHPTVIFRRQLLLKHGLRFDPDAAHAEDFDLWIRAADCFPLANQSMVGIRYRVHPDQVTKRHGTVQEDTVSILRRRQLRKLLPEATEAETALHLKLLDLDTPLSRDDLHAASAWLECLEAANGRSGRYDRGAFHVFLVRCWLNAAHRCIPPGGGVWRAWRRSRYAVSGVAGLRLLAKQAWKALRPE